MKVSAIRGTVGAGEARAIVRASAPEVQVSSLRELLYPYHWFLLRSRESAVSCLIDARTGRGSTSDRFLVETRDVAAEDVLPDVISILDARARARRAAVDALTNGRRAFFAPRFHWLASDLVYKPFWVVGCGPFSVLVDGVNGGLHPLAAAAS